MGLNKIIDEAFLIIETTKASKIMGPRTQIIANNANQTAKLEEQKVDRKVI